MANFYFNYGYVSRGQGGSAAQRINYITGRRIHDKFNGKTYYKRRKDVVWGKTYVPWDGPRRYYKVQILVDALNDAEKRKDARVARDMKGSLPNELQEAELVRIVDEFVREMLLPRGLCAVVAIHRGENDDPALNNPHCHIVLSTRKVDGDRGFYKRKDPYLNDKRFLENCRVAWQNVQNRAYERNGLDIHVDCRTLREQGIDREPQNHMSPGEYRRYRRGEQTKAGNIRKEIEARNTEREQRHMEEREKRMKKKTMLPLR